MGHSLQRVCMLLRRQAGFCAFMLDAMMCRERGAKEDPVGLMMVSMSILTLLISPGEWRSHGS
ncbi:hypothetical protein MPTK1_1g24240 [Marchantia polymorpha subsp. ruderalis]